VRTGIDAGPAWGRAQFAREAKEKRMIQRYLVRHLTPIENVRDEATVVLTTDHLAEIAKVEAENDSLKRDMTKIYQERRNAEELAHRRFEQLGNMTTRAYVAENENAALKAQVEHWRDKIRTTGYQARAELAEAHRMVELYRMSCAQYFTTHKFVDGCGIDNKYCDDCKQFMAIAPTTEAV
jgi:hypothetical protein